MTDARKCTQGNQRREFYRAVDTLRSVLLVAGVDLYTDNISKKRNKVDNLAMLSAYILKGFTSKELKIHDSKKLLRLIQGK